MATPELTILSLGWGVQSTTLAVMAARGDLPGLDFAIHADTTHERLGTYAYAAEITGWLLEHGVTVLTVTDRSRGAVSDAGDANILIPAFTLATKGFSATTYVTGQPKPFKRPAGQDTLFNPEDYDTAGGLDSVELTEGQLRRQCTSRWKITPLRQAVTRLLDERGLAKTPGVVEQWIGISWDEFSRARTSDVQYITHRYPLLERRMTRQDCVTYLERAGVGVPPKSACVFCPYHNDRAWVELKQQGGRDWEHALDVDNLIRDRRPPFPLFVHPKRIPLAEAVRTAEDVGYTQSDSLVDDVPCDNGGCFI